MSNMKLILLFTFILCTSAKDVLTVTKDNIDDTLKNNEFVLLKLEKDEHLVRLHIGLEDPKDLIADLKKALKYIK